MIWLFFIVAATLLVAYANGANDNFKGVATLFGAGITDYRKALTWATVTTFAGSIAAFFLAEKLIKTFSGKGLVMDSLLTNPAFLTSVILGAGITVLIAAKTGIPISTTHSLTGTLVGAGFMGVGWNLGFSTLTKNFLIPLLTSPLIAILLTSIVYLLFHWGRQRLGIQKSTCVCVGANIAPALSLATSRGSLLSAQPSSAIDIIIDDPSECEQIAITTYSGRLLGIEIQGLVDGFHFLSAGTVGFARGLNDTPKIVALSVTAGVLELRWNIFLVALIMALGGILSARKVAETMSKKITKMNHGQGFTANLITSMLVIFASGLGMPVSTTHVSCGALFGIGLVGGQARWSIIVGIISAWISTLPIAALIAGLSYWMLR